MKPSAFGAVLDAFLLVLAALIVAIVAVRNLLHGVGDALLLVVAVGPLSLFAVYWLLYFAFARIVVADGIIEIRDAFGKRRRFPQKLIGRAARRSIFAPVQGGIFRDELLLIGEDGRCLVRVWLSDYDIDELKALVKTLGLKWPGVRRSSIRKVMAEFPGAHRFDYQLATAAILAVLAVVLVTALAIRGR